MTDKIPCDYRTHKHIPSRSCYQLILEVSEELFPLVCDTLGFPRAGKSLYVNVELSTLENIKNISKPDIGIPISTIEKQPSINEKTEGEKLRTRAVMLCKEESFWAFTQQCIPGMFDVISETSCKIDICEHCNIKSRSELATNVKAQEKFKQLIEKFNNWKTQQQYQDNFDRVPT